MPYILSRQEQQELFMQQKLNPDGSVAYDPTNPAEFQKIYVQKNTIEERMQLKSQYGN